MTPPQPPQPPAQPTPGGGFGPNPFPAPNEQGRRSLTVADARLHRIMHRHPTSCATVNEYAGACGIGAGDIIELLGPYLDDGTLALDIWGDEVFVNTAPSGRPAPPWAADVPPNLWELLRRRANTEFSYALWKLTRSLERVGWSVEVDPARICFGLGPVNDIPYLGVNIAMTTIPLLIFPAAAALASPTGHLAAYERAGARSVGIICDEGALEEMVTAVRRWILTSVTTPQMSVLILEAPRYNITEIRGDDAAVRPISVNRAHLDLAHLNA